MGIEMNMNLNDIEIVLKVLPPNIFFKDTQCRYIFASHYWNHIEHGDDISWDIKGKTDIEIRKDKKNARIAFEQDKKILETGQGCTYIVEECFDGKTEYLEITKNPVFDDDGKIIGIAGIINNITDRVRLKQDLELYAGLDIKTGLYNFRGFAKKLPDRICTCKEKGLNGLLIVFSFGRLEIQGFDSILLISNAVRILKDEYKICARIDHDIFAVFYPCSPEKELSAEVRDFILHTMLKIERFIGDSIDFSIPEPVYCWDSPECTDSDESEKLLENMIKDVAARKDMQSDYKKVMKKLREDIIENPQIDWNVSEIIRKIGISPSHFYRTYKQLFGESCANDIINSRIECAKHLLVDTDLRVQKIAVRCGYRNEGHFMRQFRKKTGITALKYRNMYQKK